MWFNRNKFDLKIAKWSLKDGTYPLKDQLYGSTATLKVENGVGFIDVRIEPSESFIFKIN